MEQLWTLLSYFAKGENRMILDTFLAVKTHFLALEGNLAEVLGKKKGVLLQEENIHVGNQISIPLSASQTIRCM